MEVLENEKKNNNDEGYFNKAIQQIEQIIDQRLQQLTPEQVKDNCAKYNSRTPWLACDLGRRIRWFNGLSGDIGLN